MIGAIVGDIIGSRFERRNRKSKDFNMFDKSCRPTDDSIMSLAIAKSILDCDETFDDLSEKAVSNMQQFGRLYKNAGYGGSFKKWIWDNDPKPYNSFGNGSAMRVSPCGFAAKSIKEAKELAEKVSIVTHNHPEGIKGAEAIAVAIFLAREGQNKEEIRKYVKDNYYDVDFSIDQIRKGYKFDVSCQGSVPVALEAFFESKDFEDAIRTAISVGGDSDTIAAMAGSVAEAYYGVPEEIIDSTIDYLDSKQMEVLYYFEKKYPSKMLDENGELSLSVFDFLDDAVDKIIPAGATIEVEKELSNGIVHAQVDEEVMIPDFSSFDEPKEENIEDRRHQSNGKGSKKKLSLDEQLQDAINEYNYEYELLKSSGINHYHQQDKSVDLIEYVENLINSLANHPKSYDTELGEISDSKKVFKDADQFAKEQLASAKKSALGAGAGIAAGTGVVAIAPATAMWVATTFGTASTGTAISALSGAAATNAALAWLGGGAVASGGLGMAGGHALLALAGPIGWGIAGASVLASVVLFATNKKKTNSEKAKEISSVKTNIESTKELTARIEDLTSRIESLRKGVSEQYKIALSCYGKDYNSLNDGQKFELGRLVNNTKALAKLIGTQITEDNGEAAIGDEC